MSKRKLRAMESEVTTPDAASFDAELPDTSPDLRADNEPRTKRRKKAKKREASAESAPTQELPSVSTRGDETKRDDTKRDETKRDETKHDDTTPPSDDLLAERIASRVHEQLSEEIGQRYETINELLRAERDKLVERITNLRRQHAEELGRETQQASELWRRLKKTMDESEEYQRTAKARIGELEKQVSDLSEQLEETLASRNRVAERVETIEKRMEEDIVPLRQAIDTAREREAALRNELNETYAEIKRLKGGLPKL